MSSQVFFLTEKSRDPASRFLPSRYTRNKNITPARTCTEKQCAGTVFLSCPPSRTRSRIISLTGNFRYPGSVFLPPRFTRNKNIPAPFESYPRCAQAHRLGGHSLHSCPPTRTRSRIISLTGNFRYPGSVFLPPRFTRNKNIPAPFESYPRCAQAHRLGGHSLHSCPPTRTRTWDPLLKRELLWY